MTPIGLILLLQLLGVTVAGAYSYGPAETEPIAEAYTSAVAAANKGDWAAAASAYAAVKAEVEKDAGGPAATAAWEAAVTAKNGPVAVKVMRAVVYLNLQRRLTFARKAIQDYATAKVLINRATTTYEAMSPVVKAANAALDGEVRTHLDAAFDALGNPGVLGVGAKAPKPEAFDKAMNAILTGLRPLFGGDFAALAVEAAKVSGSTQPAQPAPAPAPTPASTSTSTSTAPAPSTPTSSSGSATAPATAPSSTATATATGTAPSTPAPSQPAATTTPAPAQTPAPQSSAMPTQPAPAAESAGTPWLWYLTGAVALVGVGALALRFRGRRGA